MDEPDERRWTELVARTTAVLTAVAAARATVTYAELRDRLDAPLPERGDHDLAALLRAVSTASDRAGLGLLSAVVVNASGRPGDGWFRLAAAHGRDVGDPDPAWRAELERVWTAAAPVES